MCPSLKTIKPPGRTPACSRAGGSKPHTSPSRMALRSLIFTRTSTSAKRKVTVFARSSGQMRIGVLCRSQSGRLLVCRVANLSSVALNIFGRARTASCCGGQRAQRLDLGAQLLELSAVRDCDDPVVDAPVGVAQRAETELDMTQRAIARPGLHGPARCRLGEHAMHQGLVAAEDERAEALAERLIRAAAEELFEGGVDVGDGACGVHRVQDRYREAAGAQRRT